MKNVFLTVLIVMCSVVTQSSAADSNGIIRVKSAHGVTETISKLETVLDENGMTIFARVNHASGAEKVGLKLRPTELLIFGNPKVGTPLMLCSQSAALDLPQKALAYEDEKGIVWLVYNDPAYMAKRHGISGCEQQIQKVTNALAIFSGIATK